MLNPDVKLISADDHLIEHPRVWQDRLARKFQEAGPRIVEVNDGASEQWLYEGELVWNSGLGHSAGRKRDVHHEEPQRFEDMRPGYYDPVARIKDMDVDGVSMQMCFPSWARYAGTRFYWGKDRELGLACVQAYNDFHIDEWCGAAPDRYIPLIILPLWDPALCVAELERCIDKGIKAVSFPENPAPLGLPSFHTDHWDPVFSVIAQAGLPLCMHFGTSGISPPIGKDAPLAVVSTLMGATMFSAMADLVFSPVLHKHPDLKVVFSESGIGWWPNALQRVDQVWEDYRYFDLGARGINFEARPSELIKKHFWGCFIQDPLGVELRHKIGVENLLFESDYPHADSVWPHSRKHFQEVMADVPAEEAQMIGQDNARLVFGLD